MQQYVVYAVSLVLMSTTYGEVGEFLPWVSGTDVWYDTCTSWNGVKVGANSVLYIYGRWCFNLHIIYNFNIMETVGIHIQNMITKSCYYHYLRTLRSQGHHNCLSALMITRSYVIRDEPVDIYWGLWFFPEGRDIFCPPDRGIDFFFHPAGKEIFLHESRRQFFSKAIKAEQWGSSQWRIQDLMEEGVWILKHTKIHVM